MKKFWKKFRCCCTSKDFFEPSYHERVIDEGDDNPAFENTQPEINSQKEKTETATISSPTKFRSSLYIDSLDKSALRSPPSAKHVQKIEFARDHSQISDFSSIKIKEEFSDK